jgi:hypothetical protein
MIKETKLPGESNFWQECVTILLAQRPDLSERSQPNFGPNETPAETIVWIAAIWLPKRVSAN